MRSTFCRDNNQASGKLHVIFVTIGNYFLSWSFSNLLIPFNSLELSTDTLTGLQTNGQNRGF